MIRRTGTFRPLALLLALATLLLVALPGAGAAAAAARERAAVELWNALVPLKSVNTFMNTGAHPDDEISSVLAYVSRGIGARTISLIANRGEGGQNAIGTEYGNALGVIRSRELQAAGAATAVEIIHLSKELDDPIFDFGFSKTPTETLAKWNRDVTFERLVRAIRESRPDVVMTSFLDTHGQHGHHRAMTILTEDAFRAAADPSVFPEQIKQGLRPWQVKKFYLPGDSRAGGVYADAESLPATLTVAVGEYDPMQGASYRQLGEESRSYHKSQGMGGVLPEGPATYGLHLRQSAIGAAGTEEKTIFQGLPQTVGDLAATTLDPFLQQALHDTQAAIDEALAAYPNQKRVAEAVDRAYFNVAQARGRLTRAGGDAERVNDLDHRMQVKQQQLMKAGQEAALLITRLQADTYELTRGATATFTLTAYRGGQVNVENVKLDLVVPQGWKVERVGEAKPVSLKYNETATAKFKVTVPADADFFHPYKPVNLHGMVRFGSGLTPMTATVEPQAFVAVLPDISLRPQADGMILNLDKPGPLIVNLIAANNKAGAVTTEVAPLLPAGWKAEPASAALAFKVRGETQSAAFTVTPPAGVTAGKYSVKFKASGGAASQDWMRVIEYPHIGRTYMVLPAQVDVQAFPVKVTEGLKVGYVASGFDSVPDALGQMGVQVDLLDANALTLKDLSVYHTIVIGIRAYRVRPDLVAANGRLLAYVKNGGNMVVQYHQPGDNWNAETTAPYFLKIGSPSFNWRVTDENSPVTVLAPAHPLLNSPNKIGTADWAGWVKDRGLYFPMEWATQFDALLAMNDPGEKPLTGSFLSGAYGKGRYSFTSLILYYQMEQRVPGAYRIFANLISQ